MKKAPDEFLLRQSDKLVEWFWDTCQINIFQMIRFLSVAAILLPATVGLWQFVIWPVILFLGSFGWEKLGVRWWNLSTVSYNRIKDFIARLIFFLLGIFTTVIAVNLPHLPGIINMALYSWVLFAITYLNSSFAPDRPRRPRRVLALSPLHARSSN